MPTLTPYPLVHRAAINRRLGIKSSIPQVRELIASVLLLWIGSDRQVALDYADPASDGEDRLRLHPDLQPVLVANLTRHGYALPADFKDDLERSPLFAAQMEHLQVALQLIWKLAQISFIDAAQGAAERTGGKRFVKRLSFTLVVDLCDLVMQDDAGRDRTEFLDVLLSWLKGEPLADSEHEQKLLRLLTALSEDAHMKCVIDDGEIEFQQHGIYQALTDNPGEHIQFGGEKRGPLRIISRFIKVGMHPYLLEVSRNSVGLRPESADGLKDYAKRVDTFLELSETRQEITIVSEDAGATEPTPEAAAPLPDLARNWIIYGAPGTGKSYFLEQERQRAGIKETQRVIFYSDYTYAQFVGGYRPAHLYDPTGNTDYRSSDDSAITRPGQPLVEYQFVPGPLLQMLIKAHLDPQGSYLLLIEELNRADAPAVFGDVFQLLDRDDAGRSHYPVTLSPEAMAYLRTQGLTESHVELPPNLYIWATLNNADQGVMPLDTAFKRRWAFRYMSLDEGSDKVDHHVIHSHFRDGDGNRISLSWNGLRAKINNRLSELGIDEDMHIGPFFLKSDEFASDEAFRYKLLSYLRDDVLRHRADELFSLQGATLTDLLRSYTDGNNIFCFALDE